LLDGFHEFVLDLIERLVDRGGVLAECRELRVDDDDLPLRRCLATGSDRLRGVAEVVLPCDLPRLQQCAAAFVCFSPFAG
jgi:hypothetical protein